MSPEANIYVDRTKKGHQTLYVPLRFGCPADVISLKTATQRRQNCPECYGAVGLDKRDLLRGRYYLYWHCRQNRVSWYAFSLL